MTTSLDKSPIIRQHLELAFKGNRKPQALSNVSQETRLHLAMVASLLEIPLQPDDIDLLGLLVNSAFYSTEGKFEGADFTSNPVSAALAQGVQSKMGKVGLLDLVAMHEIVPEKNDVRQATLIAVNGGISLLEAAHMGWGKPHDPEMVSTLSASAARDLKLAGRLFPSQQLVSVGQKIPDCVDALEASKAVMFGRDIDKVLKVYERRLSRAA